MIINVLSCLVLSYEKLAGGLELIRNGGMFWMNNSSEYLLGCPFPGRPNYKFGFRSSVQKNGLPGEGRHEGLVPRNDVLTTGFIRFSLARTFARIIFVPRLPPPQKTQKALRIKKTNNLRFSKWFNDRNHFISSLFEFKSIDDVGAGKLRGMLTLQTHTPFTVGSH